MSGLREAAQAVVDCYRGNNGSPHLTWREITALESEIARAALAAPAPAPAPVCGNTIGGRQCLMPKWHHGLCETGLASPAPAPDAHLAHIAECDACAIVRAAPAPNASLCDCGDGYPSYGIGRAKHLPSCHYGIIADWLAAPAEMAAEPPAQDAQSTPNDAQVSRPAPAPAPDAREAALQRIRDPRPDWPAVERLVDDAVRRGEITASRGAEILGLRLRTWRDLALEMAAERAAKDAP